MTVFDSWAKSLDARELDDLPGIPFLRMWLRRGTLEPIITRELGSNSLHGGWTENGLAKCKAFPVGVVGHWPAGNVEIQPILSMTCALLGGNAVLVRIPSGLVDLTRLLMGKLVQSDPRERLTPRIFMAAFEHGRQDLQEAMAQAVDGAMIWGGKEAVLQVRALPFPHWARMAVFGPRISVAAMDAGAWSNPDEQESWCRRIARDVWQFDQQACSSPQVLFLEKETGQSTAQFLQVLQRAFETENQAHPRQTIPAALTSAICQARASWLLKDTAHQAVFPNGPDWTLLLGSGSDLPEPIQGRTLTVLEVDNLLDPVLKFDGNVQTLGLGMTDPEKERKLAWLAGKRGVDRIVKLGCMHVFVPPWDGVDLIRPMVRMVRHVCSTD
ncbi:MAG TPA: acyl-CoA reductase [Syntrophobacteraceae bacterium]|nr:acyl-CoA reductase [Syntrophobacteraceae bacterium]